jgi:hypothetical protein
LGLRKTLFFNLVCSFVLLTGMYESVCSSAMVCEPIGPFDGSELVPGVEFLRVGPSAHVSKPFVAHNSLCDRILSAVVIASIRLDYIPLPHRGVGPFCPLSGIVLSHSLADIAGSSNILFLSHTVLDHICSSLVLNFGRDGWFPLIAFGGCFLAVALGTAAFRHSNEIVDQNQSNLQGM